MCPVLLQFNIGEFCHHNVHPQCSSAGLLRELRQIKAVQEKAQRWCCGAVHENMMHLQPFLHSLSPLNERRWQQSFLLHFCFATSKPVVSVQAVVLFDQASSTMLYFVRTYQSFLLCHVLLPGSNLCRVRALFPLPSPQRVYLGTLGP